MSKIISPLSNSVFDIFSSILAVGDVICEISEDILSVCKLLCFSSSPHSWKLLFSELLVLICSEIAVSEIIWLFLSSWLSETGNWIWECTVFSVPIKFLSHWTFILSIKQNKKYKELYVHKIYIYIE